MIDSHGDIPANYRPLLQALLKLGCTVRDEVLAHYYEEYVVFDALGAELARDYFLGNALHDAYKTLTGTEWVA